MKRNSGRNGAETDVPAFTPSAAAWHALPEAEVLKRLEAPAEGLTNDQAAERRRTFGSNVLPSKPPPTLFAIFLHQFLSPLIYVLLAAGVIAILMGDASDAGFIFGVVLLNAGLGTYQEWKAERSSASLQQLLRITARVKRNGEFLDLPAEDIVPGDWVRLESGMRVPADLRILEASGLAADEALLTGESVAAEKVTGVLDEGLTVSDRRNMAFAGTIVATGRAAGVVVATGLRTEVGKIAKSVTSSQSAKPPLVIRMEAFARQVSLVTLAACLLLGGVALSQGMPAYDVFFLAIALAVAAIPEGLPVAMTVALSIATSRMAKRNVIVRKLTAVEGLGSCTFIASDKTGTLTLNRQTLQTVWLPAAGMVRLQAETDPSEPKQVEELCRLAMIASETVARLEHGTWTFAGDAVDAAFWRLALQLGIDPAEVSAIPHLGEIPFESDRAYAATFYLRDGVTHVALKGAPEVVLARCQAAASSDCGSALNLSEAENALVELAESGHRVMAIATGIVQQLPPGRALDERDLPPLTLAGFAGLIDPPRTEVRTAVERCQQAGILVAMVTGDHPRTALAIAREVGIKASTEQVVTGKALAEIGTPDIPLFIETVKSGRVFARVTPLQKLQIVDALVKLGHFVAVTGDGVNDAPALKRAHIGVAMGSGTDVTKETASIIVTDDNFASIEAGVEEGRFAYDNIRKVTYLLISTGLAEVLLFALALLSGMPLPLLPVQLLWLNLVANGIQDVSLAFEGGEPGTMARAPRKPTEGVFNRFMVQQTVVASVTMALLAYVNFYLLVNYLGLNEFDARNRLLLLMVLMVNYHAFNCRSEYVSVFRVPLRRNWMLVWGVLGAQGIHILAMFYPPAQKVLRIAPVSVAEWIVPFALAAIVLLVMEAFKMRRHGRSTAWPASAGAARSEGA
jgi:P-type Ca2+ transporter type 2C